MTEPPRPLDELAAAFDSTLRSVADGIRSDGPLDQAVRPTELVQECYERLAENPDYRLMDRSSLLGLAARVMRNLLVDRARRDRRWRTTRITSADLATMTSAGDVELLALDDALSRLSAQDERQARIVELKFFGGLTGEEIGHLMGLAGHTVTGEWQRARAWLRGELDA
jgi:RNA polymerase sigma-70 factor (ECF subfamily)